MAKRKSAKYQRPVPKRKGSRGAPRHAPTDAFRAAVAAGAATFLSHDLIALQLGISKPTLLKHYRLELDTAADRATAGVVSRLYKHTEKHPVACFFWLQNRDADRWKHANLLRHQHDATGKLGSFADLVMQSMQPAAPAPAAAPATPGAEPVGPAFTDPKAPK